MSNFVHLHRHSEFSRLDGIGTAKQYADRAAQLGQAALAQTDHGTLSGALHHIEACKQAGIQPISGVEAYYRPDRAKAKANKETKAYHLCLYAKNIKGWRSLLNIVSTAYAEVEDGGGFYNYPCVDWELLERYNEGLICSTACISSWLSHLVNLGHDSEVKEYFARMKRIFGDDLWIEIMPHDFHEQRILNLELISVAKEYSIPLLATNDAHFPYPEWAETQRMAKIMGSGSSLNQAKIDAAAGKATYLAEVNPTLYLCTEAEMRKWFSEYHDKIPERVIDEAISNTSLFAQKITPFLLSKKNKLPRVTESVDESRKILRKWIAEGLRKEKSAWKFRDGLKGEAFLERVKEYEERVETEWKVLESKGVLDYFVMVGEIVRWCMSDEPLPPAKKGDSLAARFSEHDEEGYKKKPIRVGLGRGSAAGCLISYLVGIVRIDPIAYGLLFERFLNPNRKGLPDIDLDFQSDRRAEVKEFIARRYGRDHVADIITHQRFQPKKVLVDLCRAYNVPYQEGRKVTDTIEIRQDDEETTLEEILPLNDKLKEFKDNYPELWEHALRLEGTVANAGKHAAGVIITPDPIVKHMALERGGAGDLVTSWSDAADFAVVSDYGFVKIDALGIKGLQKHDYACDLIKERTGKKIDLYSLPALRNPDAVDKDVMQGFADGLTVGIFQFGSSGITRLLKSIKPDNILDIAAANALYRPGPMKGGTTWEFPKRKHNKFLRQYQHPDLKTWLAETYGIIAYQEQVMQIAGGIGRLSAGDTDDMRKAMGKLYRIKGGSAAKDFMAKFEVPFFQGAEEDHGWTHEAAEAVWELFIEFGHYGFNKSHSCSYALQAYQDMYLKILYPHEFYAAFLTFEEDEDKIRAAVREARVLGVELEPPLLNKSDVGYTTDGKTLRLGLCSINKMGLKSAKAAMKHRPFTDIEDLFSRGKGIPYRQMIESGACDDFLTDADGNTGIEGRRYMLSTVVKEKRNGETEPWKVWEHLKHNMGLKNSRPVPKLYDPPSDDALESLRMDSFKIPLKESSMTHAVVEYIKENCHSGEEFEKLNSGENVVIGGEIIKVEHKLTKTGKPFANVRIAFESDEFACKFWSGELSRFSDVLTVGNEVLVSGSKDVWNDFESIVVDDLTLISDFQIPEEDE